VAYAASFFEWFAEEAKRVYGATIPETVGGRKLLTVKQPVGVAALITPWNFPAAMITRKVGPALGAGCGAVVKPAEDTPLTALALAVLGERAGVPKGLLSVLPTPRKHASAVGEELCTHPKVAKVSFTGSTAVGVQLQTWCAAGVKRTSLELGGNAPFLVFEDADLEVAVSALMACKFRNSGQTCVSANKVLVHEKVHGAFVAALAERMQDSLVLGHGLSEGTTQGPLINSNGVDKVRRHVADAVAKGAVVAYQHERASGDLGNGCFFPPTLLTGCTPAMACFQEETFGPLVSVAAFDSEAEALAIANSADVGLAGYFCSRDLATVFRVAQALEVGMVGVNEGAISTEVAPFGGVKMSGLGREGGAAGIEEYLNTKYICLGGLS